MHKLFRLKTDAAIKELAAQFSAEQVQLYYQIGLIGKRDLPLAPTPQTGFEMVMLRMLAFAPEEMTPPKNADNAPIVTEKKNA